MCDVPGEVCQPGPIESPPEGPCPEQTVLLRVVRHDLFQIRIAKGPYADAYGREAPEVLGMPRVLCLLRNPEESHEEAHGGRLQMQLLRQSICLQSGEECKDD